MPLHLNSITNDSQNRDVLTWLLYNAIHESTGAFITENKRYSHLTNLIRDQRTGKTIGRFVFTLFQNEAEKRMEVLDLDIVLDNPNATDLQYIRMLPGSSDSNEYHEVEVVGDEQHLLIETVNRYVIDGKIAGTNQSVHVSAFPFELSVYENMDALNTWAGFDRLGEIGNTGLRVNGFSEHFTAPGSVFSRKNGDSKFSFIVGIVDSYEDVTIKLGNNTFDFVVIWLDTALGIIPVAAGREVFDLEGLATGKVVAMNADIKTDFADYSVWHWQKA